MKKALTVLLAVLFLLEGAHISVHRVAAEGSRSLSLDACNLSFQDSVYLKYAVSAENVDKNDVSLLVFTGENAAYDLSHADDVITDLTTETINEKEYIIFTYKNLSAKQMTDTVYARPYANIGGDEVYGNTVKYSILQYAYNKLGKTGSAGSEQLQNLLTQMLSYGAAAQNYFNYQTDRLATSDYFQIRLTGGVLPDGFDHGLYQTGDEVSISAPDNDGEEDFYRWKDENGSTVSTSAVFNYTVKSKNVALTPVYGNDGGSLAPGVPATFTAQSVTTSENGTFRYWLYTPADPEEDMPLLVYLHGGSGKGDDLTLITGVDGFPKYLQDGDLGDVRAYVVIPQLPSTVKGWTNAGSDLMTLINSVRSTYGISASRVSLTGHSMGGTGTWGVAAAYPATFAKIAPCSGSINNTTLNVNKLKNVPVRAFVGADDTIVSPDSSINFVASLKEAGADAEVTIFEGAGHFDIPALVYQDEDIGILDWLLDT